MELPDTMDNDVRDILGIMLPDSGRIARAMRDDGAVIPRQPQHEQAAVLHWLLTVYAQHGGSWREVAGDHLQALGARNVDKRGTDTEPSLPVPYGHEPSCATRSP